MSQVDERKDVAMATNRRQLSGRELILVVLVPFVVANICVIGLAWIFARHRTGITEILFACAGGVAYLLMFLYIRNAYRKVKGEDWSKRTTVCVCILLLLLLLSILSKLVLVVHGQ